MRRLLIAGNWKMNLNRKEAVALAQSLVQQTASPRDVDLAVCPPYVYLDAVQDALAESHTVSLGAQDMYHESAGAFTGEISAEMLLDVGCRYVILGHSERRHILGETDQAINYKVHAAHSAGLIPIVCVGETLSERESNATSQIIRQQFDGSLAEVSSEQMKTTVIAYEPVWAIGTGRVATPQQAAEVHADLRELIGTRYNADVAESVRIQYGGSVKPDNARELLQLADIDGALVGGASLKADSFMAIADAAS